jgi:hypothetical protein
MGVALPCDRGHRCGYARYRAKCRLGYFAGFPNRKSAVSSARSRTPNWVAQGVVVAVAATLLISGCSKGRAPESGEAGPPGLELTATRVEVVGAGASSVPRTDQIAKDVLGPLDRYYEETLFGITFPAESFEAAFEEFTPTIARTASGDQASLMTLGDVGPRIKGVLEPSQVTSTVTAFAPQEGLVSHAGVAVSLRASGALDDGTPIEITRQDFFIVEKSSKGWKVISYECRQKIDAPPQLSREQAGGSGG